MSSGSSEASLQMGFVTSAQLLINGNALKDHCLRMGDSTPKALRDTITKMNESVCLISTLMVSCLIPILLEDATYDLEIAGDPPVYHNFTILGGLPIGMWVGTTNLGANNMSVLFCSLSFTLMVFIIAALVGVMNIIIVGLVEDGAMTEFVKEEFFMLNLPICCVSLGFFPLALIPFSLWAAPRFGSLTVIVGCIFFAGIIVSLELLRKGIESLYKVNLNKTSPLEWSEEARRCVGVVDDRGSWRSAQDWANTTTPLLWDPDRKQVRRMNRDDEEEEESARQGARRLAATALEPELKKQVDQWLIDGAVCQNDFIKAVVEILKVHAARTHAAAGGGGVQEAPTAADQPEQAAAAAAEEGDADAEKQLTQLFKSLDLDRDRRLDRGELEKVFANIGRFDLGRRKLIDRLVWLEEGDVYKRQRELEEEAAKQGPLRLPGDQQMKPAKNFNAKTAPANSILL
jgi:hypothetical protein